MSKIPEFTTIVGLDTEHMREFSVVWPTWTRHKPEILRNPMIVICDAKPVAAKDPGSIEWWHQNLASFFDCPSPQVSFVSPNEFPQRERMLTALVRAVQHVKTPYYLKLDTDCVATKGGEWIDPAWFKGNPVFVSSRWGYTKPSDAIHRLDNWGDTVPEVAKYPRLDIPFDPNSRLVRHRRIISWCMFGNTEWTRRMSALAPNRLPVPSQDTFLWYCAARRGDFYRTAPMKKHGWAHINGLRKLRKAVDLALNETPA